MYLKPLPMLTIDIIWRLWNHVDRKSPDECWLWQKTTARYKDSSNSTRFDVPEFSIGGHNYTATRVAYKLLKGVDPEQLLVCHTCDNPYCVNPNHLWLGNASENSIDCVEKGRNAHWNNMKLWPDDVLRIRELLDEGKVSQTELAKMFRVSDATISRIKKGTSRSNIY